MGATARFEVSIPDAQMRRALANIENASSEIQGAVRDAIKKTAVSIEGESKRNIQKNGSTNFGVLWSNIHTKPDLTSRYVWWVKSEAMYSYFVEFGRAAGKRPPIEPILLWVRRKLGKVGKDAESTAFLIARAIGRLGTRPQPFLFPAAEAEKNRFVMRMKTALRTKPKP